MSSHATKQPFDRVKCRKHHTLTFLRLGMVSSSTSNPTQTKQIELLPEAMKLTVVLQNLAQRHRNKDDARDCLKQ